MSPIPISTPVPIRALLGRRYLEERAALISPTRSMGKAEAGRPGQTPRNASVISTTRTRFQAPAKYDGRGRGRQRGRS